MKNSFHTRRQFLVKSGILSGISIAGIPSMANIQKTQQPNNQIMTVSGLISAEELGTCLPHEHIISRFGEDPKDFTNYNYEKSIAEIVPYLRHMKKIGCTSIMCCTVRYFGRDAKLLQKISKASTIHIITNTGFYGAANDRYIPKFAFENNTDKIAQIWIDEFNIGIDNTGIRPGFVKVGIDSGPMSEIDTKLVRAGAICHRETGMVMQVHTGNNLPAVKKQLDILKSEGVAPNAWIWIHAQSVKSNEDLLYAAEKGAWISLDALRTVNYYEQRSKISITVERHLELLKFLREHGYLNQILLSHDGSLYPQEGKSKRSFETLFTTFIPMMKSAGFSESEIHQLICVNPRNAFILKKRLV